MQGVLHKRFQQGKFSAESNQPASRPSHSTSDIPALAPRYQHSRSHCAELACPGPDGAAHVISYNSRCSCILWKNAWEKLLFSGVLLSFSGIFQVSKIFSLRAWRKKSKYCCLRRRAREKVHSPNALSLLLTVVSIFPSALGLPGSPDVKNIWKEDAPLLRGRPVASHFGPAVTLLRIFQQWRSGLGWRALQIRLL